MRPYATSEIAGENPIGGGDYSVIYGRGWDGNPEVAASQSRATARPLLPLVIEAVGGPPKTVVDVGCNTGIFLQEFQRLGVERVLGLDGEWVPRERLQIPTSAFRAVDLRKPVALPEHFDLAMSLEVAEHLEPEYADTFVDSLVSLAPIVLFSAALPLQRGTHHVNCRWPEYWAEKFRARGYVPIDCLRDQLLPLPDVGHPYAMNTILYVARETLPKHPTLQGRLDPRMTRVPIKIRTEDHPLAWMANRLPPLPREWLFYVSRRLLRHSPI